MGKVKVSVIIIVYNGLRFLDDCLKSVLDQEMPREKYEVLAVDNNSTDGSVEYIERNYPEVRVIKMDHNYGFSIASNRALKFARGNYMVILPQDTLVHRKWLSEMVRVADNSPVIKACSPNTVNPQSFDFKSKNRTSPPRFLYYPQITPLGYINPLVRPYSEEIAYTLAIAGTSFLIKREVLEELDYLFEEKFFHYCADSDLGIRINLLGYKVALVASSVIFHLDVGKSLLSLSLVGRYLRGSVDRILMFYKDMGSLEFILYLPFLLTGIAAKVFSLRLSPFTQVLLFNAVLIISPLIILFALPRMKLLSPKKVLIKSRYRQKDFWLLKSLLKG